MAMESSEMQKSVLESIESGTSALKKLQETMKLEDVEKLLQENKEAIEYQEEVSAILGQELRPGDVPDDEQLEEELNRYLEKEKDKETGKEPKEPEVETELPSAPMNLKPGPVAGKAKEANNGATEEDDPKEEERDKVIEAKTKNVAQATPA